jgi:hypothetical protein
MKTSPCDRRYFICSVQLQSNKWDRATKCQLASNELQIAPPHMSDNHGTKLGVQQPRKEEDVDKALRDLKM